MKIIKLNIFVLILLLTSSFIQAQTVISSDFFNKMWAAAEKGSFGEDEKKLLKKDIELADLFNRELLPNGHFDWFTLRKKERKTLSDKKIQQDGLSDWNVYPNPTNGNLVNVVFTLEQEYPIQIKLFNLLGKSERTVYNRITSGTNQLEIDVEGLSKGVYFLIIESEAREIAIKYKLIVS